MNRYFPKTQIWVLAATLIGIYILTSCVKQEEFSDIPEISARQFTLIFDTGQYAVRGILAFNFQDGDGDIGLNPGDTFAPYNRAGNYYYNLVIRYFEKQDSGYAEVVLDPPFSARIPVLNPDYPGKTIRGYIADTLTMDPTPSFDTIRFEYFIYDRALSKSNVLTTPDIVLKR
ncbi:MAG: hypothetical protein IH596_11355 [Bacteroidales bacterium]|nr:hypothetical protein [Bacteroidales bacterium]